MFIIPLACFWIAAFALVFAQIVNGYTWDRSWEPWCYRDEEPVKFWAIVAAQVAMLLFVGGRWLYEGMQQ